MSRGIVYLVWGTSHSEILKRSIASLKYWHPELEYRVVELKEGGNVLAKSEMFRLSPFEETLFLDADTTVMGNLNYGFLKAKQFGMALCISANPWNRRYYQIEQHPDEVEYSSGVVFFDKKKETVRKVFEQWNRNSSRVFSETKYIAEDGTVKEQQYNDQALLTLAIQQEGFNPFILSQNWNLFPKWQKTFFGEIKILHGYDNIPQSLMEWNKRQSQPEAVIQYASFPAVSQ